MRPVEITLRIQTLERELQLWKNILANKSCHDCAHFANAPICALAHGASPPPEVQKVGCPSWVWDEIPF